jgi:hypothetical protein
MNGPRRRVCQDSGAGLTCNHDERPTSMSSQATKPDTTIPSRRALLAGAPAVAAVALAAGTAANGLAIVATSPSGDAELLALKPEFDRIFDTWLAKKLSEHANQREYVANHVRVFGFPPEDAPAIDWDDAEYVTYDATWKQKYDEELRTTGDARDPNLDDWDEIHEVLFPLADEVLSHTATTVDGLRLQTRALISAYDSETWSPLGWNDDEPENPRLRDFVQSVCNVLGIPFPPLPNWREARS